MRFRVTNRPLWKTLACSFSLIIAAIVCQASPARAELDPDLAKVGTKNDAGFFVGGNLGLGQGRPTNGDTPGVAYNVNVEPGFVFRRDSWNRVEASLQLGAGRVGFSNENANVSMPIGFMAMARFGYGYSLGSSAFGVLRAGFGMVNALYKADLSNTSGSAPTSLQSRETLWGTAAVIGFDVIAPMTDTIDMVGGLEITHMQFSLGDVKYNTGDIGHVGESVNMNVPTLQLGIRVKI